MRDELKYERDNYRKDELLLSRPPSGYEIDDPPGKSCLFLLKEYKNEAIVIELDLDNQPSVEEMEDYNGDGQDGDNNGDDSDDEEEVVVPVKFKVSVSKGGHALIFECQSDGEYVIINHIAYELGPDAGGGDEDEDAVGEGTPSYAGPVFDELDETLQQAFLDYLEQRGVTIELGQYLRSLCIDKMQREYQAWLTRVRGFVAP